MEEWRPINTAPHDGTEIIVGRDMATVWVVCGARFVRATDWADPSPDETDGWWSQRNSVTQEKLDGGYEPTHWLPMPCQPRQ